MILQSHPSGDDGWLVVTGAARVLALPAGESARVEALVERLLQADGFRAALESLVSAGIASAPPFALLDGDTEVLRVVLRGDAVVTATVHGAEVTFSGQGMSTWTERVLEGATAVELTVPGSTWTIALDAPRQAAATHEVAVAADPIRPADPVPAAETAVDGETTLVPGAPPQPVLDEPDADPDSEAYDFLFGDTIYRTQAGVSVRIPNPDPQRPGDHDGQTMLADDLGLRGRAAPVDLIVADPAPSLPLGPALQLERADGSRESLSRPVLIGRAPTAGGAGAGSGTGAEPRLITILDDPDISRTHLRVAVEGD
ncbi:MAG: hypothetical protein ABUT11_04040, partial [Leifsonia sp.]